MPGKHREQQIDAPFCKGHDAIFNSRIQEDVPEAVSQWCCSRILLVASKSLASKTQHIADLQSKLGDKLVDTKLGVGAHSPYADVRDIALRIQQHKIDCVVSVGGCSYSDACKIATLLAANLDAGFSVQDMEALIDQDRGHAVSRDDKQLKDRACRLILVPTSLSASEWNAVSSSVNSQGKKQHFGDWERGHSDLILLDPTVAADTPEDLWVSSGVRCIDHCVELMCNPKSGEPGLEGVHVYAEKGLRCILTGLTEYKTAEREKSTTGQVDRDLLLRGIMECQYGSRSSFASLVIWRVPMGPSHAIGHQLGPYAKIMHGVTSAVMLAPVVRWQAAYLENPHYKKAQAKILSIFNETMGWQETSATDAIEKFVKSVGLPTTLTEVGVTTDEGLRVIAEKTLTDVWGGGKRQLDFEQLMEILESAK